ncbi:iron uptake transporter deferrochelatase/peroxidase subunit, partial [Rhodospirillum rubrum]
PALPLGRRHLLTGFGLTALGGSLAGLAASARADDRQTQSAPHATDAPVDGVASPNDTVAYLGVHQAGIVTPRPANGMVASFAVLADTPDALETLFKTLTARIAFLTVGGAVPQLDPKLPPADSGLLGPVIRPDALTITLSVGASLFDERPWLAPHKPRHLSRMTRFPNDALDADLCHGDLSIQICANTQDTTIHALRDLIKATSRQLVLRWKQEGTVPVIAPRPDDRPESARNFLGFRDGSANPDSSDAPTMDRVVWVGRQDGEPAWAVGGSYQAVRLIRNFVERWDRTPFGEQERIFGRTKITGAPLDKPDGHETDGPDYAADRDGRKTPLDSHIRLANARDAAAQENLILRRPFNYSNGVTKSGQLDQGLLFIAYQANLDRGFIAVQNKLNNEPLEEYIKPIGGGYFYTLPGIIEASDYVGSTLVAAARGVSP